MLIYFFQKKGELTLYGLIYVKSCRAPGRSSNYCSTKRSVRIFPGLCIMIFAHTGRDWQTDTTNNCMVEINRPMGALWIASNLLSLDLRRLGHP